MPTVLNEPRGQREIPFSWRGKRGDPCFMKLIKASELNKYLKDNEMFKKP